MSAPEHTLSKKLVIFLAPLGCLTTTARQEYIGRPTYFFVHPEQFQPSTMPDSYLRRLDSGLTNYHLIITDFQPETSEDLLLKTCAHAKERGVDVFLEGLFVDLPLERYLEHALHMMTLDKPFADVEALLGNDSTIIQRLLVSLQSLPEKFSHISQHAVNSRLCAVNLTTNNTQISTFNPVEIHEDSPTYQRFLGLADIDPINHGLHVQLRASPSDSSYEKWGTGNRLGFHFSVRPEAAPGNPEPWLPEPLRLEF